MARRLMAFLGKGNYSEVYYAVNGRRHQTRYAPAALAHLLEPPPDDVLVFATDEAERMHGNVLRQELGDILRLVRIPAGGKEVEMWEVFNIVTQQVEPNDELIFDITHSFRSLPFLSFLALAFLRVTKQVKVAGVYYGAYDARDMETNTAPFFNLTPFVDLLDWTVAADRFIRFGDGRDLAQKVKAIKARWAQTGVEASRIKQLDTTASRLDDVSLSIRLIRPHETMEAADMLSKAIAQWGEDAGANSELAPFAFLLERVQDAFQPLAKAKPAQTSDLEDLRRQRMLIRWYADHEQYTQAIAMAREWFITWCLWRRRRSPWYDEKLRRYMEDELGVALSHFKTGDKPPSSEYSEEEVSLFGKISERRNDMLHAGMRRRPTPAAKLRQGIQEVVGELEKLPLEDHTTP
ncbi:MAG: TIGR02221 family CRISPR-associated protein [Anaerolineae bacterium]